MNATHKGLILGLRVSSFETLSCCVFAFNRVKGGRDGFAEQGLRFDHELIV